MMQLTQAIRRACQMRGKAVAVNFGDHATTWHQFADRVARLAGALQRMGLTAEGRVAMLAHNSHRYAEFFYAPIWSGGVPVPMNTRLSLTELTDQLNDAQPAVLLVDRSFAETGAQLRSRVSSLTHLVFADDGPAPPGMVDYEAALAAAEPAADAMRGGGDTACLFYTGGTTGLGKGVILSHDNIYANCLNLIALLGMDETSAHLHCGPLFHVAPGVRIFAATIAAARHVILSRFVPAETLATIAQRKVTIATFVPTMIGMMLRLPEFDSYDLSTLKVVTYGSAPMPEAILRELMQRVPGLRLGQAYGMTELSPMITFLSPRDHLTGLEDGRLLRSAGRAVFGSEVKIVDSNDKELPVGSIGEIVARGPMVMKGYWRMPELTATALRGGWMHTGDAGYMDEDGYLFVVDRVKDMIVSGGENIYSIEVENAIQRHPAVYQSAVIGVPDEFWGESVLAVVVPKPGQDVTPDQIIEHCRGLIAHYKCPKRVEIRSDPLPLSGANKIHKAAIRSPYWVGKSRHVN